MRDRIIQLRKALRLTQGEFGKRLGLTTSGVSNIENGLRDVSERHVLLILSAFPQVSEDWLRNGTGDMLKETPQEPEIERIIRAHDFDAITARMLRTYHELTADQQQIVLDYFHRVLLGFITEGDIDLKVESYRQELLAQKNLTSSASPNTEEGA